MKKEEMFSLEPGALVCHKRYGACKVVTVIPEFGITIRPFSRRGKFLLQWDSGSKSGTPLLECQQRNINPLVLMRRSGVARVRGLVNRMRAAGL